MIRTTLFVALAALSLGAHAADPALPSVALKPFSHGAPLIVPAADVRSLVEEDSKAQGQAMPYGRVQNVDQTLIEGGASLQGQWQRLDDERELWAMRLQSEGAVSLDLHFSRMQLPEQAELYLADAAGDYVLGPIRGSDALADLQYYTALIPGDSVTLELVVPAQQRDQVDLRLSGVTYGYRGLFGLPDHADAGRSGSCNIDVACAAGEFSNQADAVGQYVYIRNGSSYSCTGALVGNTAGTPIPYFITGHHCVSSEAAAQSIRVYWNYQSPECRQPGSDESGTPLPKPSSYSNGASLRMSYANNDTSLVELNAPVPASEHPFFAGWDRRDLATTGFQVPYSYSIHHPSGHEKRYSWSSNALTITNYLSDTHVSNGSHYRVEWQYGTTEGGSTGAPLFDQNDRVIGTLHGGYASCSDNRPDWYGRIYQSWAGGGTDATRLSTWLDPMDNGVIFITGYRPWSSADTGIFCSSFESGESGSCEDSSGPEVVSSALLNIELNPTIGHGFAINWVTGATCHCLDEYDYHFGIYKAFDLFGTTFLGFNFYPRVPGLQRAGVVHDGKYAVLGSGAVIGPAATFGAVGGSEMATVMADWRAGATGYFGFRFTNPQTGRINYGYAELRTTAGTGFPMTLVRYHYNRAGNPITIP